MIVLTAAFFFLGVHYNGHLGLVSVKTSLTTPLRTKPLLLGIYKSKEWPNPRRCTLVKGVLGDLILDAERNSLW